MEQKDDISKVKHADKNKSHQNISTEIITTCEDIEAMQEEWNSLVEAANAHIFQTFE